MLQKGAKESKLLIYLSQNNERTTVQVFHHVIQTRETDESSSPFTSREGFHFCQVFGETRSKSF